MADATESSASRSAGVPDSSAPTPAPAPYPADSEDIATDSSVTASDEASQVPRRVVLTLLTNASAKAVNLQ